MKAITYSLKDGAGGSDSFYRAAAQFADRVLLHAKERMLPAAEEFRHHALRSQTVPIRSTEEYALETLTLGVLWRCYRAEAESLRPWQGRMLAQLVRMRTVSKRLKPTADRMRAMWNEAWLMRVEAGCAAEAGDDAGARPNVPTLDGLDRLLTWLAASGEFNQEADRLSLWREYLSRLPVHGARGVLQAAIAEAKWFEAASEEALGRYTRQVEPFRASLLRRRQGQGQGQGHPREDALLCARRRVEYHLNLVGAELLNRAFRKPYEASASYAVLLPTCLKAKPDGVCPATTVAVGPFRCLLCTADCRIAAITRLAERHGFEVIVTPHESDAFSRQVTDRLVRDKVGIVGVACALNLLSGGWRAQSLGIPAQCVILDYCGCSAHWDDHGGVPTDLNLQRLMQILHTNRPE